MSNDTQRHTLNVAGAYFVDTDCIACDTCTAIAPRQFALDDTHSQAFVSAQPQSQSDYTACEDARHKCPVGAIGNTAS